MFGKLFGKHKESAGQIGPRPTSNFGGGGGGGAQSSGAKTVEAIQKLGEVPHLCCPHAHLHQPFPRLRSGAQSQAQDFKPHHDRHADGGVADEAADAPGKEMRTRSRASPGADEGQEQARQALQHSPSCKTGLEECLSDVSVWCRAKADARCRRPPLRSPPARCNLSISTFACLRPISTGILQM